MFNINQFLEKFKQFGNNEIVLRQTVKQGIFEIVGVEIDPKTISYKNTIITIKGSSLLKNEIFMKKKALLDYCTTKTTLVITDIR